MTRSYAASEAMLERALKTIPLGSQTFSKSLTQYPHGVSPFFIEKASGSRVVDVDGNEYIDFVSALAAVTLGYGDPDVQQAVQRQLADGVLFSLPHRLEHEVAELIVEMVPCAEKVRFGKNGSDATSGAIRIARAYTSRDRVAVCGYHGWQDWYIGATARNRGVPQATRDLTHTFQYNDIGSLEALLAKHPGEFAAIILEPMNAQDPANSFLSQVRETATRSGALLVFDETVTGFRFSNGGAQEYFGVTPDLAVFGKGLANGFPLSAVVGKAEYMSLMEEVFFSFTMGGELLSLAAAHATLTKLKTQPILSTVAARGARLVGDLRRLIDAHSLGDILSVSGHPAWSFLNFQGAGNYSVWQIKTLWLQEILARGILCLGTHNLSYAHSEQDIDTLISVYDEVFGLIAGAIKARTLEGFLKCRPLEPLFKVR